MVYATQYMIGNAIVGMTNLYGVDGMQIGQQESSSCHKPIAGIRFSSPLWRIRET